MMLAEIGLRNISDANGIGIAVTGMVIVFVALTLITVFIAALPRFLTSLEGVLGPEVEHRGGHSPQPAGLAAADEKLVAAIGYALHLQKTGGQ